MKKTISLLLSVVLLFSVMPMMLASSENLKNIVINGVTYTETFFDDFDGTSLDTTKWNYAPEWNRQNNYCRWDNDMTWLDGNGHLILSSQYDENGDLLTGAVRTRELFEQKQGYFEISCKLQQINGIWSAFWLMPNEIDTNGEDGGQDGTEIDVFEAYSYKDKKINHAIHYDGYGDRHKSLGTAVTADVYDGKFHKFALEWKEDCYIFYIDGKQTHEITDAEVDMSQIASYIKISVESGSWTGKPNANDLPANLEVDYVRAYQRVGFEETTTPTTTPSQPISNGWNVMYDWEGYTSYTQVSDIVEAGTPDQAKYQTYLGMATITNAENYPEAQTNRLEDSIKAINFQQNTMHTITGAGAYARAGKIKLDTAKMANAKDLRFYLCYKYPTANDGTTINQVIGIKLKNGEYRFQNGWNDPDANSETMSSRYGKKWNWYNFVGKTFKLCTDTSNIIEITEENVKDIEEILIWNRANTAAWNWDTNRTFVDNVEYLTDAKTFNVTIDGVSTSVLEGKNYKFPVSSADGFVAYTDGKNYYDASETIVVNGDLSFETISIGRVSMLKGAQFRLGEKNGIRFLTTVDMQKLESVATKYSATIQKGTIIAPRDLVSGDFVYSSNVANVVYDSDVYYAENTFVGSIVNIKESSAYNQESGNIARDFVGRGYVKVTIGDFEKIIYASYDNSNIRNNTRSLAYLAYCLQNDTENAELYEEFKTKVDKWAAYYEVADYNALFDLSAKEYLSNIRVGINTGRSLDCQINKSGDTYTVEDLKAQEQKYDFINPTDVELIRSFKEQGFNAVRMPVTWSEAIGPGPDYIVSDILMDRVQEVIDIILAEDMYCILNSHNEFNWLYTRHSDLNGMHAKFKALWKQIAERFKDYDGRLIFEGYNEVLKLPEDWSEKADSDYAQVNLLAQEFVDTVRATGGNNEKRFLVVAPYGAGCYKENLSKFVLPTDTADNKLIVDVHYYFPSQSLHVNGTAFVFENAKSELDAAFDLVQTYLLDKGYAVMMNETAFSDEATPLAEREKWADYVFTKATQMDIPMYWWDNGFVLRLFDRDNAPYNPVYPTIIEVIMNATADRVK